MVEDGHGGLPRGRKLDKVGQEESDTAELFFSDVRVPDANRIGERGHGLHRDDAAPARRSGSGPPAPTSPTPSRSCSRRSSTPRSARRSASRSARFQHNKFKLAELVTSIEVAEAYVDDCIEAHAEGRLSAVDAAKAKWWSAQVQNDVLDECVQLHGGYGFMNEYRVARAWRDARVTKIWAGSNEIMKELIGRDLGL